MVEETDNSELDKKIQDTIQRLAETQTELESLMEGQVDAVVTPEGGGLILLRDAQAALAESQARYHRLVTNMSALVFETAPDGTVLFVNDATATITGYNPDELIGNNWWEILCPAQMHFQRETLTARLRTGDVRSYQLILQSRDKQELILELNSANRYRDGELRTIVGFAIDVTERKHAEQALRESEERYRLLIESVAEGVFGVDLNGNCTFINPAGLRLLGYDKAAQLIGKPMHPMIHHTQADGSLCREDQCRVNRSFRENRDFFVDDEQYWRSDGSTFDVEYRSHPIRREGAVVGSVVTFSDISERRQIEEQRRQAATVFNNTMDAIIVTDADRNIVAVNQAYTNINGFAPEEVLGKNLWLQKSGRHDEAFYRRLWHELDQNGQWQGEIWNRRKNGEVYPAWENISVVKDDQGQITNYVSVLSDISLIKQAEEQLRQLAHHDSLTGLPNRLAFAVNLEQALERAKRHELKVALLFLDLDRFKHINDTMGHATGDRLLQTVSARLKQCVRAEDTVARLGGDEFTIILDEISHAEDAAILAGKIIKAIEEPMLIEDREVMTSTSIGISVYPDDARNAEDLAKAADAAMYRAKERGRHTYEFYTMELTSMALEHLAMEDALQQALAKKEFVLHYQPLLDLKNHKIIGVEALLRWQHPQKGLIGPDTFIGVAEETGLIQPIGNWVLREACMQAAAWRAEGLPPLRMAINLTERQTLHEELANTIQDTLKQCGLSTVDLRLEFEVSERMLYIRERSLDALRQLRSLGVNIAIDDFGTGYSSLRQLKRLPVDTLKIDRIFMQDIPGDPGDQAIAAAIISLGHTMDLKVVAEGVETSAQLHFLESQGCDEVQGFLFSKPVTHDQIRHLLASA